MHNTLFGFCWWDLPAAIILIAILIIFILRHRKLTKRIDDLENKLNSLFEESVDVEKGI